MSLRYLLDTNICIYIRGKQPKVVAHFEKLERGDVGISIITYGELAYGVARSAHPERAVAGLYQLTSLLPVLPLPLEAGEKYGPLRASLEKQGKTIGSNDLWIAAHAIAANLILVTNNEREFKRVPGLKFENWAK